MSKPYLCCLCFLMVCTNPVLCQSVVSKETVIFRLSEGEITIVPSPPKEWNTCVAVQDGGAVYIEKRNHLIAEPQAELKVYRGQLTDAEFNDLQRLLADSSLVGISDRNAIRPPPTNTKLAWITAAIKRESSVQEIDYRYWSEHSTEYATATASYIASEKDRLRLLTPIVDWAGAIDTTNFQPAHLTHGICIE